MTNYSMMVLKGVNVMLNRLTFNEPTNTIPTTFQVGVTTTDVAWGDTALTDAVEIVGGNYFKPLNSITHDETNGNIVYDGWLSVTDANGNLLTGFAVFNDDDPVSLIAKSKFTGISKTNTELFKFSLKIKFRDQGDI